MTFVIRRKHALGASMLAVVAASAVGLPAAQAATPAQKAPLTDVNRNCDGTVVGTGSDHAHGFAVLVKPGSGKLVAAVALKDGLPGTTYDVRLIQILPDGSDCGTIGGTLTTDADGDGNTNVQEPVLPGATKAFVVLNNHNDFGQFYLTAPLTF